MTKTKKTLHDDPPGLTKEEKLIYVAECALSLILTHGIDSLTHSKLARAGKVSRPWLYKYVGRNDADVINFAVDHFGRMFAYLDRPTENERVKWIKAIVDGTDRMLSKVEAYPWIILLYYRYFGTSNILGERVGYIKGLYLSKVTEEVITSFSYPRAHASFIAETVTNFQLTLAYHWVRAQSRNDVNRKLTLEIMRSWLEAIPQPVR
jgi:hypothetical protein